MYGGMKSDHNKIVILHLYSYFPDTLRVADTSEGTGEEDLE